MTGKIVGNIFLMICGLLCSLSLVAQGVLKIVDEEGNSLKTAQAGRPFTIELEISGGGSLDDTPYIEGLKQFSLLDSSWSQTIINGAVTISYRYNVIAAKPGFYTIGPAEYERNSVSESSNSIELEVGNQHIFETEDAPVLVRLFLNKDRAVVGERIVAAVRYYYSDPSYMLRNFIEQPMEDIIRKKPRGPRQGTETIDDVEYNYTEFDFDLYPQSAGELTIPAFAAEYEVKMARDHLWQGISRLFDMATRQKRAYSNAVTIHVDEIPQSDLSVQGVGQFDAFEISAHPSVVSQGEGVIVTLTLRGDFNPQQVNLTGLQNVPKELKYYDSNESVQEPQDARNPVVLQHEYIVQGLQTGSWEIPSQQFHYYDVATRSHRTLTTAPLSMTILPGAPKQKVPRPKDASEKKEALTPLSQREFYPAVDSLVMPWWLFFMLLVAPFFVWIVHRGRSALNLKREKTYRARKSYYAFSTAKAALQSLKKEKDSKRLYTLFMELFADKWQVPIGSITAEYIADRFQVIGMAKSEQAQWNDFFAIISQQAFGVEKPEEHITDLFEQAEQWLERLKQLL